MENEDFGACLDRLLKRERNTYTVAGLATKLGFTEGSTIYRWLRGEKTPAMQSPHIHLIIEYLRLNEDQANELRAAQVYSLSAIPPRQRKKRPPEESDVVAMLVDKAKVDKAKVDEAKKERSQDTHPPTQPNAPGAIILLQMIELLKAAPPPGNRSEENRTITLTWQSRNYIGISDELQEKWEKALRQVMQRGWRIRYLCRLDHNLDRTVQLVHMMRELLSTGNYYPRYFTTYGVLSPTHDLLVIPGVGAVLLFSSNRENVDDGSIFIDDVEEVRMLQGHARLLAANTKPLVIPFFAYDADPYSSMLYEAEAHRGGRRALKDGLSIITQPEGWYTDSPIRRAPTTTHALETWEKNSRNRAERIAAFKRYLGQCEYYDICTEEGIKNLARNGAYPADDLINQGTQPLKIRLEHLCNVVHLLETYSNYHLGLVSECQRNSEDDDRISFDIKYAITADNSVFLGIYAPTAIRGSNAMGMRIREPTVAEGFKRYFDKLWNKIPPINRDSKHIIKWLKPYIRELEQEYAREQQRQIAHEIAVSQN